MKDYQIKDAILKYLCENRSETPTTKGLRDRIDCPLEDHDRFEGA